MPWLASVPVAQVFVAGISAGYAWAKSVDRTINQ